jgi:DNA-directed RNA polymerase specialized sigma24 family protein
MGNIIGRLRPLILGQQASGNVSSAQKIHREAVILKEYHGWKLREIAAHQGTTTNVVAGLPARGLAKLRELLDDQE